MNFRVDVDTWFVFCILFITALFLLVVGFVAIPFFLRKKQLKRIQSKSLRKKSLYEQLETKMKAQEMSSLESRNFLLETNLEASLRELIKSNFNALQVSAFYAEFEKVYPHFYESLYQLIPEISTQEVRLCSLIRMNLTAKEISQILNITPASVNKARYRLRKKISLEPQEDLDSFILSV
ncbi:hypothetical protein MM213_06965 [Belliella sp. R4-6]|uniref:HTH luxR-type domain-containing protein n=1 Tax=Belliella alkalica TaxID=1730871 RepID=A0ABS9V9V7_9BACT|nr:hypothetical protein [Belliella alkalica]MCH7413216.1 hypothetical protein [Belliella alkalica]